VLHGGHAPFVRPNGSSLNDAQRAAFVYILEEREAMRQRSKLEAAVKRLAAGGASSFDATAEGGTGAETAQALVELRRAPQRAAVILEKLYKQQARLRALGGMLVSRRPHRPLALTGRQPSEFDVFSSPTPAAAGAGPSLGDGFESSRSLSATFSSAGASSTALVSEPGTVNSSRGAAVVAAADAVEQLEASTGASATASSAQRHDDQDADLDRLAESGLSNSAIVDVLVGVREDFGSAAGGIANEGASFGSAGGGGGGGGGGASKGSGATNDLFAAPAFAAGRVFSFTVMDAVICEVGKIIHYHVVVTFIEM
jgi:hypothetical protein